MAEHKKFLPHNFIQEIKDIILTSRANAVRSVDFCRVQMYWQMGKRIFEEEQEGKERALESAIITNLQEFLLEMGDGFAFIARRKATARKGGRVGQRVQ